MALVSQYTELYPWMIPELPGLPESSAGVFPLALQALKIAGRQFCERSEAWLEWLDPIDLEDEVVDYELTPPYNAEIRKIVEVRINTEEGVTEGEDGVTQDDAYYEWDPDNDTLTLDDSLEPTEDIDDALDVRVMLVPFLNTDELPQWFINRYTEGLVGFAMVHLMTMPEKPWTTLVRAGYYQKQYERALGNALKDTADEAKIEGEGIGA